MKKMILALSLLSAGNLMAYDLCFSKLKSKRGSNYILKVSCPKNPSADARLSDIEVGNGAFTSSKKTNKLLRKARLKRDNMMATLGYEPLSKFGNLMVYKSIASDLDKNSIVVAETNLGPNNLISKKVESKLSLSSGWSKKIQDNQSLINLKKEADESGFNLVSEYKSSVIKDSKLMKIVSPVQSEYHLRVYERVQRGNDI